MNSKLPAVLVSLAALLSFVGAIFLPEHRSGLIILGASLIIIGTFVARAMRG